MTNKEILQADLLDILFEHRNKLYGAYALRKNYKHRLGLALGVALSTVLLLIMMSFINHEKGNSDIFKNNDIIQLTDVNIDKPEEPEPIKSKPEIKPPQAEVDYQQYKIVKDNEADKDLVDMDEIKDANISNQTVAGDKSDDIVKPPTESTGTGSAPAPETKEVNEQPLPSHGPLFPGGTEAWLAFLQRNLQSPEDLEPGQRIEVMVRFWVDVDGKISRPEVIKSGGSSFDREVLRVLKKMPRWEPALQAGNPIAVAYSQPVIFLGVEQ